MVIENKRFIANNYICKSCGHYGKLDYKKRLSMIVDKDSFEETNCHADFFDPINFPGYLEKYEKLINKTHLSEAIVTGKACINCYDVMIGVIDTRFMMGSMGVIVGEKVTKMQRKGRFRL